MTYGRPHYLVTLGGGLAGGEIWQVGLRYAVTGGDDAAALQGNLANISVADVYQLGAAVLATNSSLGMWPSSTSIKWAKIAVIKVDGEYQGEPVIHSPANPQVGQDNGGGMPPQNAIVVTLWSGQTLGKGNYGRIYWPATTLKVGPTGQMFAAEASHMATLMQNMINGITGELSTLQVPNAYPAIMSQAAGTLSRPVTTIKVGRVFDTQRRRRGAIREAYVELAL